MSRALDDEERFREERAEQLRKRDREREPPPAFRPVRRDLAAGDAFKTRIADRAQETARTARLARADATDLPGWRKPLGVCDEGGRERQSLADAVLQLADRLQTSDELLAGVREEWGSCGPEKLQAVLDELVAVGAIRMRGDSYVSARGER